MQSTESSNATRERANRQPRGPFDALRRGEESVAIDRDDFGRPEIAEDLDFSPSGIFRVRLGRPRSNRRSEAVAKDLDLAEFGGCGQDLANKLELFRQMKPEVEWSIVQMLRSDRDLGQSKRPDRSFKRSLLYRYEPTPSVMDRQTRRCQSPADQAEGHREDPSPRCLVLEFERAFQEHLDPLQECGSESITTIVKRGRSRCRGRKLVG